MKKYLLVILLLISIKPAKADSSFLPGLEFTKLYENDSLIQSTYKNGIDQERFIGFLNSDKHTLGEKAALISSLASFFEGKENDKDEYFSAYTKTYKQLIENKYKTAIENNKIPAETRLLYYLLADFGTSDPAKEKYKTIAAQLPKSLTAQSIMVIAYAYDILYGAKKQYGILQDLENNYVKPYRATYAQLDRDIPLDVAESCVFELLKYTENCEGKLSCLCDINNKDGLPDCLNKLSKEYIRKIEQKEILPLFGARADWDTIKPFALEWIKAEESIIDALKTTSFNKEAIRYLLISQTYNLMCNFNALNSYSLYSFDNKIKEQTTTCKNDAACILKNIQQEQKAILLQTGIKANKLEKASQQQINFSQSLYKDTNGSMDVAVAASADGNAAVYFTDNVHQLRAILYYYMINADKIMEVY